MVELGELATGDAGAALCAEERGGQDADAGTLRASGVEEEVSRAVPAPDAGRREQGQARRDRKSVV